MINRSVVERIKLRRRLTGPEPSSVAIKEHPEIAGTQCLFWLGATSGNYGMIKYDGRTHVVHRLLWKMLYANIPDHILVCHKCDRGFCINEKHLFLSTQKGNMLDMKRKHRSPNRSGDKNTVACLTNKQVRRIRSLFTQGVDRTNLVEEFRVSRQVINGVIAKRHYIDV